MKTVSPNVLTLALRIVLLPFTVWLVAFPVYRFLQGDYTDKPRVAFIGIFFFVLFLAYNVMSLMGVFKIRFNETSGEIILYRLYKSCSISITEIDRYYITVFETRWKDYPGYFLVLKDGRVIELTEYNLTALLPFYAYFVSSGVPCKGTKTSWYPIKRRLLKT